MGRVLIDGRYSGLQSARTFTSSCEAQSSAISSLWNFARRRKTSEEKRERDGDTRGSTSLGAVGRRCPRHGSSKKRCRENSTQEGPPKRSEHRETLLPPKEKRRSAQTGHLNQQRFVAQGLWEHARCRSTQYGLGGIQRLDTSWISHAVGFRIFCAARF